MATGGECSFVNFTTPTSKEERLQNLYLIRSRTVKINRRKQLLRTSREQEDYSSRKIAGPGRKLLPAGSQPPSSRKIDVDEYVKVRGVTTVHERILLAKDEHRQCQGRELQNNSLDSSLVLPSPVSPFFGALATSTFDSSSHSAVSEISSRVFNTLLSRVFGPTEISAYYQAFCQNPLVFYSYAHLHLFVHDNVHSLHSTIDEREKTRKYSLNIKISAMLQEALPSLQDEDIEPVLLAMTLMAKHREDADVQALSVQSTLFVPYELYAELLEAFQAGHIESFVPAVRALVNRVGGLNQLKTPGLSKMIRMNGLIQASTNDHAPYFDNCWNTHRLLAAQGPIWDILPSTEAPPGIGFQTLVPGGLPPVALAACMNLSTTDRLLSLQPPHEVTVKEFQLLTSARASVQHQLLSLPTWSNLQPYETGQSSPFLYGCIRDTALLYCNAVVRPVLPGSKGVQEPLRRLRLGLESVDTAACGADCRAVMFWCLVMGSLGSCSTQHWWFFVARLKECLARFAISTIEEVIEIVSPFVWSDMACRRGLDVVWRAMYG